MSDSLFSDQLRRIGRETVAPEPRVSLFTRPDNEGQLNIDPELGPNEQLVSDKRLLPPTAFARRYGAAAERQRNFQGASAVADPIRRGEVKSTGRTLEEVSSDSLKSFGSGLTQGGAGLLNLGSNILDASIKAHLGENNLYDNKAFTREVAETADFVAGDFRDAGSLNLRNKRNVAGLEKAPKIADSSLEYQQDLQRNAERFEEESKGSTVPLGAKLRQIGRDTLAKGARIKRDAFIAGENFIDNPAVAGDTVAQATGSLLPSLVGSGGTTALAKGVLNKTAFGTATKGSIEKAVTAGSVGLIEGQGAYNSTVTEVGRMSFEQLNANSAEFRNLVASGVSQIDAKNEVAHLSGLKAQQIQTGLATIAGFGVSKFEGNPLGKTSLGGSAGTLATQTVEEAFQSGTGQLTSNIGVRQFADSTRDASQGVGEAAAEGALGGFGATGVIQGPQTAKVAAVTGPHAVEQAFKAAAGQVETRIDKKNPTGEASTNTRISSLTEALTSVVVGLDPQNDSDRATYAALPTELLDTAAEDYVARTESFKSDVVQNSRVATVKNVAAQLQRGAYRLDPQQELAAAVFVKQEIEALRKYTNENQTTEETASTFPDIIAREVSQILANKTFQQAETKADTIFSTTEEAPAGASGEAATLFGVTSAPVDVTPSRIETVLENSEDLSPVQTAALEAAAEINVTSDVTGEPTLKGNSVKDRASVRQELVFGDSSNPSYGSLPSFNALVANVIKGAFAQEETGNTEILDEQNNPVDAQDSFERLGNLAQHQINKFEAATQSLRFGLVNPGKDGSQIYSTLDPVTGTRFSPPGRGNSIFINPGSEQSLETYQQVREDANTGISAYNTLLSKFPDVYQGQPLALIPEIDSELITRARDYTAPEVQSATETTSQETQQTEAPSETQTDTTVREDSQDSGTDSATVDSSGTNQSDETGPDLNQRIRSTLDEANRAEREAQETKRQELAALEIATRPVPEGDTATETETSEASATPPANPNIGQNLVVDANGQNVLLNTYDLSPVAGPETDLLDLVSQAELKYEFTEEQENALKALLGEVDVILDGMNEALRKNIQRLYGPKDGKITYEEILRENNRGNASIKDIQKVRAGRVLPLVDAQSLEDGAPSYDSDLMGLAVLAAMDYVMNTPAAGGLSKESDVLQALGLPKDTYVTTEMWDVVNFGRSATDGKESLARHIKDFWGARDNKDISESQTKGIAEAVADEILDYLSSAGTDADFWFQKSSIQVTGGAVKTYAGFRSGPKGEALGNAKGVIRDVLVPKEANIHQYSIGGKFGPYAVPETLKRDGNTLIPEVKRKAIENQQNTEFKISTGFRDMVDFFGVDALASILGHVDVSDLDVPYNDYHVKSIVGKNLSIAASINNTLEQVNRVQAFADKQGIDVASVPVHYRLEVSLNGRFFMQGFNPQSNKLAREMFSPNQTSLDLSNAEHKKLLYVAIGQALDLSDLKIENLGLDESARYAESLLSEGVYRDAVEAIKNRETQGQTAATETLQTALAGQDIERSARLLKALYTAAAYETALENGETSLDIDLPIELDGKTNGPISAAIQNNLESFSPEFLALVRRGGFFIGGDVAPNDYADFQTRNDTADLYEAVGDIKSSKLAQLNLDIKRGNRTTDVKSRDAVLEGQGLLLELISELGDISFQKSRTEVDAAGNVTRIPGELRVKRRGTKGPITQQLYGAGGSSIAAGITNAIHKMVYEEISVAMQNKDGARLKRLTKLVDDLGAFDLREDFKTKQITAGFVLTSNPLNDALTSRNALEKFRFHAEDHTRMTNAIAKLYVPAFEAALEESVGSSVKDLNNLLVAATTNHTEIYLDVTNSALQAETQKQRDSGKIGKGDELSANDRNSVLSRFRKYAPIYDAGASVFNLSSGDSETSTQVQARRDGQAKGQKEVSFNPRSETLSGSTSASKRSTLSEAGVRILPYSVIANADVAMITEVASGLEAGIQYLAVHDGIETTITDIQQMSEIANRSVFNSWQKNTINPVLDTLKSLSELSSNLEQLGVSSEKISQLQDDIAELEKASIRRQAKIDALNTVQLSVDGVPGAQSPFVKSTGLSFSNEAELLSHLNNEFASNIAAQEASLIQEKELTAEQNIDIEPASGSDLRRALVALVNEQGEISPRQFIETVEAHITDAGQMSVIGQIKKSAAFSDIVEGGLTDGGLKIVLEDTAATGGRYDMNTNTLYVSNITPETSLHEIVHASTVDQVLEHYNAPETTSERGKAITRLESLMYDFAKRSYPAGSLEALVQSEVLAGLTKDTINGKVEALSEFMAWSLSNEKLIEKGKAKQALDPLSQAKALGRRALGLMRRILGFTSNKVFDHILFNTTIILNAEQTATNQNSALQRSVLNQRTTAQNTNENSAETSRKSELQKLLNDQLEAFRSVPELVRDEGRPQLREEAILDAQDRSNEALNRVVAAGFNFTSAQDVNLFRTLAAMFSMDLATDKVARLEAQQMFEAVADKITPETFLKLMGTDYINATQSEERRADNMHAAAVGLIFEDPNNLGSLLKPEVDSKGNTDRLGVFLALSQTNEDMRQILSDLDFQDLGLNTEFDNSTLDGLLDSLTRFSLQSVTGRVLKPGEAKADVNAQEAMDVLTHMLSFIDAEASGSAEAAVTGAVERANNKAADAISQTGETISNAGQAASEAISGLNGDRPDTVLQKLAGTFASVVTLFGDLLVPERARAQAGALTQFLNGPTIPTAVREVYSEIRGRTDDTAGVFDLVKKTKQFVSAVRQEYREKVPTILADQFSDAFSEIDPKDRAGSKARIRRDWAYMYRGLGRTDFSHLVSALGERRAFRLFGDSDLKQQMRNQQIKASRAEVATAAKALGLPAAQTARIVEAYQDKASQLAFFMINDTAGINLLSSARAIIGLYNEDGLSLNNADYTALQQALEANRLPDEPGFNASIRALEKSIDTLASVEAVNNLRGDISKRLQVLANDETQGIRYSLNYMSDLREQEQNKTDSQGAKINGYKGYLSSTARPKLSIVVESNSKHNDLVKAGYTRIRDYDGPEAQLTRNNDPKSYYFSSFAGLSNYNQGALQTVQQSYNGVDPTTGFTLGPETDSTITGDYAKLLNRRIKNNPDLVTEDGLIPVFNEYGDLVGFEQSLAPDMIDMLQSTENFAEGLANWSGRIVEEQAAIGFNEDLLDALHDVWDTRLPGSEDEFVELSYESDDVKNDKILQDNFRLIPRAAKTYGKEKFGGPIMVRRDMINNALGFRSASVSDVFTGQTRINETLRSNVENVGLAIFGANANKYLTNTENVVQTIVSEAKHTIVVKSVIILGANTVSNVVQLMGRGVPPKYMAQRSKAMYAEVSQYKRNEEKKIKIRADIVSAKTNNAKAALQNRLETIEESERRMSIFPLIENGEFTTISEGLTDADKAFMDGKFIDWIEAKAAELPGGASTLARYAIVSRDTALYRGLARGVQYSDFIAKGVYFEHLTKNLGIDKDEALSTISEEFINYDLADGRTRSYLESVGLTWFLNFKLRSIKIGLDLIRNNPLTALLSVGAAGAVGLDVGSPLTDNAVAATADGRIGYSIGPGMVQAGWTLNPWRQLFS